MALVKLNINGKEITAEAGKTVLEAALENGIEIPHLCFDKRLEVYAGCGLCIIEIEGQPKIARSCATYVADGLVVRSDTPKVIEARNNALNLLVSQHIGDCKAPCTLNCPANTDVQGYVGLVANKQYIESLKLIKEKLPLPACIGRVCPHPCEDACRRQHVEEPVSIACIKTFAADYDLNTGNPYIPELKPATGKKVAVVGAGPAGLSAAYYLLVDGHEVDVFEAMPKPGGMLRYGIPEYRLPKNVVDAEVAIIEKMGANFNYGVKVGEDISLDYLRTKYDAVFLGIGAWKSSSLRCEGEDTPGVIGGIDFLIRVAENKPVKIGRKVIVVGGGNTAMDVARTSIRLGAEEVRVVYRRSEDQMPAEKIEIKEAKEEGVIFSFLSAPSLVLSDGDKVTGLRCEKMVLGEKDESGRQSPVPTGEFVEFEADTIIAAIGQEVDCGNIKVGLGKKKNIAIKEGTFETNLEGVFAGGDAATGPKIAIEAVAQGGRAARVITTYLAGEMIPYKNIPLVYTEVTKEDFKDEKVIPRVPHRTVEPEIRKHNFQPILPTMTEEEAVREGQRCLECGCKDYFECQLVDYIKKYEVDTKKYHAINERRFKETDHPFISQNVDKCVLCGLCVRACDEVVGASALGFVERGNATFVAPAFQQELKMTSCISCGHCIDVCPVGAWLDRRNNMKEIPLNLEKTKSVCSYCSVGCEIVYEHKDNKVYLASSKENEIPACGKGKFGIEHINHEKRLLKPKVRIKGNYEPIELDTAIFETAKRLRSIQNMYGQDQIAFVVSPKLTNEEFKYIKAVADELNTKYKGSFTLDSEPGIEAVLGRNESTVGMEELDNADLIISVGHLYEHHPSAGMKLRRLSETKKIISASTIKTKLESFASKADLTDYEVFFTRVLKALVDTGFIKKERITSYENGEDLIKALDKVEVLPEALKVAEAFKKARKPIILADENTVPKAALKVLADITLLAGNDRRPHRGLIVQKAKVNSQGAWNIGFRTPGEEIRKALLNNELKGLVVIGEDVLGNVPELKEAVDKLKFFAAFDIMENETTANAEYLLPLCSIAESSGTIVSADGTVRNVVQAIKPLTGMSNLEMFKKLAELLNGEYKEDVEDEIKVKLYVPTLKGGEKEYQVFDTVEKAFLAKLKENCIKTL
ncbi:MAG: FAD-dependent oxidoreductase [Bacillota bacterium]|jgi:formate dehydrogenase major subunit|nr:FAD-dependent oxidoreductase [Bacillota bacterium]NLL59416.1 FAD-dependent oxidoreductase [Tissierellia bacterium]